MNQPPAQDPLAQLKDIHLPEPIGWWPLAPGWWILAALAVTAIVIGCYLLRRRIVHNRYRNTALNELKQQFADYREHGQQQQLCQQILSILRRCLVTTGFSSANLSASGLLQELNRQAGKPLFKEQLIAHMDELTYAPCPTPLDENNLTHFQQGAIQWITLRNQTRKGAGRAGETVAQ